MNKQTMKHQIAWRIWCNVKRQCEVVVGVVVVQVINGFFVTPTTATNATTQVRNYQYKTMQQNAMQFTATPIRGEEEEARICLKSATVTATTTTSTAPFLPFHYGPHPALPQPTSLPSVFQQPSISAADASV
jgi:hypothetical protein